MKFLAFNILFLFYWLAVNAQLSLQNKGIVQIQFTPGKPVNIITPSIALGAAFDGHEKGDMEYMLSAESIKAMKSVGLMPLSYRLRTELEGDVWHWNPKGTWSEGKKQQGYWISDSNSVKPINVSYGYALPRRGNTIDNGNNTGYSRLDDGDDKTFWKSNPYLDEHFTNEPNTEHPQWVVVDLGKLYEINALQIKWGDPYAASFKLEYALDIGSDYFEPFQPGLWHSFSTKKFFNKNGDAKIILICDKPVKARMVRITMIQNNNPITNSSDIRDRLGFAIKEIELGLLDKKGNFSDWVKHTPDHTKQTRMWVSSTDPWHRATDIDVNTEQAGIDRFFNCGLTGKQPTMMPVGLLYDTPKNMEALVKYLKAKKYPVEEFEMGEEPEGQLMSPVDYGSLYCQWAKKLQQISPDIRLGGPGFAGISFKEQDTSAYTEAKWTSIFLKYLQQHNSTKYFNFFTTEWYPFSGDCNPSAEQLAVAPQRLNNALKYIKAVLPPNFPIYITEYGYSAFSTAAEVEISGVLMYADIAGKFLSLGGNKAFLYGYEPAYLQYDKCGWGNNILLTLDDDGNIKFKTAAYYGMKMLMENWAHPSDEKMEVYTADCNIFNNQKQPLVSAYSIRHNDNKWSVTIINKDPLKEKEIDVLIFNSADGKTSSIHFPAEVVQYSQAQYHWVSNGSKGHPSLSLPPVKKEINKNSDIILPPYSLTVISEK
jgi:hypothetical protein